MAKSCVTPLKYVSVPRLEVTTATLAVKVAALLKQELDIKVDQKMFLTDSRVVLNYNSEHQKTLQNICGQSHTPNQK